MLHSAATMNRAPLRHALVAGVALLAGSPAAAQAPDGSAVFQRSCVSCHVGAADSRAPAPEALRGRSPQSIVESLVTGAMRAQGARLSGAERRALAEFLSGTSIAGDVRGADTGRCTTADAPAGDRARAPRWSGWSPSSGN